MKHNIFSLTLAVLLIGVSACQKVMLQNCSDAQTQRITIVASDDSAAAQSDESKTYFSNNAILWKTGEYVMMYYNDGADKYAKSLSSSASASSGKASATFDFDITPSSASSYTLGGIYPYKTVKSKSSATAVSVELPAMQNATASTYDPSAFIMVLKPQTVTTIPSQWKAWFRRATALNCITLKGVKEDVYRVEITAPVDIAGRQSFNLKTGNNVKITSGQKTITVKYATALPKGDVNIWFTSWDAVIASGSTLTVKVYGATKNYTKTITAAGSGISFKESELNKLSINFSSVSGVAYNMADFAKVYAEALDTWSSTKASSLDIGGITITGNYIPEDYCVKLGANSYNKANAYDIAIQGFVSLMGGKSLTMAIPTPANNEWAPNPYVETAINGGEFTNQMVDLNFLKNYANRMQTYASTNKRWSNFCNYTNGSGETVDKGTPSVAGKYGGVCCVSRSYLIMARFYKYLLDNNIKSGVASACSGMLLNAALFTPSKARYLPDIPALVKKADIVKSVSSFTTRGLYDGVSQTNLSLTLTTGQKENVFIVCADLKSGAVGLQTVMSNNSSTAPSGAWPQQTPTAMANALTKAGRTTVAIINADFWNTSTIIPRGAFHTNGKVVKTTFQTMGNKQGISYMGYVASTNAMSITTKSNYETYGAKYTDLTGGGNFLVVDGVKRDASTFPDNDRHPRTAIGYSSDGFVYFFCVDGRNEGVSEGMVYTDMGSVLEAIGCYRAVNLDGGGSTVMSVRNPVSGKMATANKPSDGSERAVVNCWALYIK